MTSRLRKAREKAGLSRAVLGDMVGMSRQGIRYLEDKDGAPTIANAQKIAAALGAQVEELWPVREVK